MGPIVIIAHCSSASHKEWLQFINDLGPDWRVLAPDFIGYGRSGAWPEGKVFTGQADLAVLLALAGMTEKQVHLVGHSYGAAMALEAARALGDKVQSLALVEPASFNLLRVEGRPEWAEVEKLGRAVLSAVSERQGPRGGRVLHALLVRPLPLVALAGGIQGGHHRDHSQGRARIHDRDSSQTPSLATTRAVKAPTLLIVGSKTRAPARAVVDMLGATLPNATVTVLNDAGHMSPFTHPSEVNRMIAGHLAAQRQ